MIDKVLRGAMIGAMTSLVALPVWAGELQLVGLKVNHEDKGGIDALWHDERYHVSVADLASLDISTKSQDDGMQFQTPLGDRVVSFDQLVYHDGVAYVSLDTLKILGITAVYSQADLQIHLIMATLPKQQPTQKAEPIITHTPSVAGLQGLNFDSQVTGSTHGADHHHYYHQLDAFGYALGGTWGVAVSKSDDNKTQLDNAYWLTSDDDMAVRFGSTDTPFGTITGANFAYSNANIARHLTTHADGRTTTLINSSSHDYQHIRGVGVAGGLAELRINGRAVARVQSLLDGRYEFLNLDMSAIDRQSLIEVAIFDNPLSAVPMRVERVSLAKRYGSVATDELLVQAGVGRVGVFDDRTAKTAYTNVAYGLNNKVSLRAGLKYQQNGNTSWQMGANIAPDPHTNVDLDYRHNGNFRLDARHEQKTWQANYRYTSSAHRDGRHYLGLYYTPDDHRHLSLTQSGKNTSVYARYKINDRLSHDIQYQSHKGYWRYHVSYRQIGGRFDGSYQYSIDPHKHHLSSSLRLTGDTTLQQSVYVGHGANKTHDNKRAFGVESSLQHRISNNQSLSLGASWHNLTHKDNILLQGQWQYQSKHGINVSAGYRHGGSAWYGQYEDRIGKGYFNDTKQSAGEWFLRIGLNAYKAPASLPKLGKYVASGGTDGQAVITLLHDRQDFRKSADEPMYFNVDHKLISANALAGADKKSTYLLDLPKGVYEIKLDGRSLPIEYALPTKAVAKIDARLPTYIEWQMTQVYGIRGQLSLADVQVEVWQGDKLIADTKTDTDGYFLLDGLPKGEYVLRADGYLPKQVVVVDDYVLGVVLDRVFNDQ